MEVIKDIEIKVEVEDVLKAQGGGVNTSPKILAGAGNAVTEAMELTEPLIAYRFVKIQRVEGENVWMEEAGTGEVRKLHMGPNASLLKNAREAMVSVHSIGSAMDNAIKALNDDKKYLDGYLLDAAGLVALSEVGNRGQKIVEEYAAEKGWGVSPSLSPGSLEGWETSEQENLCSFMDLTGTGISLTDSSLLLPFKTVSTLIGTGPGYKSKKVGSICKLCTFRETCWKKKSGKVSLEK